MLQQIHTIAQEAGKRILAHYQGDTAVDQKADRSPLTAADRASHEYIVRELASLTPDIPIVSEESDRHPDPAQMNRYWLVDPLDGTKEFIKKSGEFTVNIALVESGVARLGVVHVPALGRSYLGRQGEPPRRIDRDGTDRPISTTAADPDRLRVVASKDHAGPKLREALDRIPSVQILSMGSSLKFCLVAEGKADLYPRFVGTMEWDTAAAQCIVEAAGGRVLDLDGRTLRYGKPTWTNPAIITVGDSSLPWKRYFPDSA